MDFLHKKTTENYENLKRSFKKYYFEFFFIANKHSIILTGFVGSKTVVFIKLILRKPNNNFRGFPISDKEGGGINSRESN